MRAPIPMPPPESSDAHPTAGEVQHERRHWGINSGYSSGAEGEPTGVPPQVLNSPTDTHHQHHRDPITASSAAGGVTSAVGPVVHDRFAPGSIHERGSTPASPFNSNPNSPRVRPRNQRLRAVPSQTMGTPSSIRDQQMLAMRPRTRTIDGNSTSREASPPAIYVRQRNRMGTSNSVSNPLGVGTGTDDVVTSIGHPSTVPQQPSFTATKRKAEAGKKLGKINHTLRDVPKNPVPKEGAAIPVRPLPPLATPSAEHRLDRDNLLRLMKSSGGKMEGQLAFRRAETAPWSLSFCSINDDTGSLVFEPNSRDAAAKILLPDLRGCQIRTSYDIESSLPYLDISPQNSKMHVHLRPHTPDEWDAWFAALLCWQPIRPKGAQGRMTKPQPTFTSERKHSDPAAGSASARHSELKLPREAPVIKFGQMTLWDANVAAIPAASTKLSKSARVDQIYRRRQQVSCQLRENGEFSLHLEQDMLLIATIHLSALSRCAIQRLDSSLLDTNFCIAIFPQYTANGASSDISTPIYLSLESRVIFEAWLVLLRAFTVPQLYGPSDQTAAAYNETNVASATGGMFRLERALSICVVEARVAQAMSPRIHESLSSHRSDSQHSKTIYYTDILLDGELRARTNLKDEDSTSLFWREEFDFPDLPASISVVSFVLRRRPPPSKSSSRISKDEARRLQNTVHALLSPEINGDVMEDEIVGQTDVFVDDLESGKQTEKWWPMINLQGFGAGEMLVRLVAEENVILMANDYIPMSELLHRFSNGLTLQIAQRINGELKRLAECLLSIFQVSGKASEWINNLVEEEIDGTMNEEPQPRIRYPSRRLSSNEAGETTYQNHSFYSTKVRGEKGSAAIEANLLFRGNTLATKALDLHMKRLGKDYLEETLGERLREIAETNPECEVDPNKIVNQNDMDRNWRRLLHHTEQCWSSIMDSADKCPGELRYIFRNIASCAEDRYGGYAPVVKYSSVSGFLFLRFFVPAILNPKLFGLLKEHPKPVARRAFTLVAKSLQGLANMSTFGAKEDWMEGMNAFLTAHRQTFKQYIDNICSVPSTHIQATLPPAYSTPLTILSRLPPTSREGFPSLPHLIDHAKSFSMLVALWLQQCAGQAIPTNGSDLAQFHQQCLFLRKRTENCLAQAERADRPSSRDDAFYEEIVETIESIDSAARGGHQRSQSGNAAAASRLSTSAAPILERPGTSAAAMQAHSRGDSFGSKPVLSARSTSSGTSTAAGSRSWRGPGRQLSLEILPTTRQLVISREPRDVGASVAPAPVAAPAAPRSGRHSRAEHSAAVSNATSPLAGSDSAEAEEFGRRSGRTTPSHQRGEESRMHRWVHGHGLGMSLVGDLGRSSRRTGSESSKERVSRRTESRNGAVAVSGKHTENSRASSSASVQRPSDSRGNDSDGGVMAHNHGVLAGGWSAEHVFPTPSSQQQQQTTQQRVAPIREALSRSSNRDTDEMTGDLQMGGFAASTSNMGAAFGSAPRPSSRLSQRAPRRDWTPDERAKREQRTFGIVSSTPAAAVAAGPVSNSARIKQSAFAAAPPGVSSGHNTGGEGSAPESLDNSSEDEAFGILASDITDRSYRQLRHGTQQSQSRESTRRQTRRLHRRDQTDDDADEADLLDMSESASTTALPRFTREQHAQILAQAHEKVHGSQSLLHLASPSSSQAQQAGEGGSSGAPRDRDRDRDRERGDGRLLLERMKWKKRKG